MGYFIFTKVTVLPTD